MSKRSRNALVEASMFVIPLFTVIVLRDWYDDGQIAASPGFFAFCFVMFLGAWTASRLRKGAND